MITLLDGYPDDVLAISATGQVTARDYEKVLIPEGEARLAASKALDLRNDAGARLAESRNDLLDQLRETDLLAEDFLGNGEHRVALTLGETLRAVADRNFPNGTYQPVVPDDALQKIRGEIAARRKKPEAR